MVGDAVRLWRMCCAAPWRAPASLTEPTAIGRRLLGLIGVLVAVMPLRAGGVTISVFGLFRPQQLVVSPVQASRLQLSAGGELLTIEGGRGVRLSRRGASVALDDPAVGSAVDAVQVTPSAPAGRFVLEVPGKIRREFEGGLEVRVRGGSLQAIVRMKLESAVAAIVAAEGGDLAPAALEAQAVAARSYLTASTGRHTGYQFCDTTHCQYLADPPAPGSAASQATKQTRNLVLAYRGTRFVPLYTRSCGGMTRTPSDVGFTDGAYPYQRIRCPICARDCVAWSADRPASELAAILSKPGDENARLEVVRKLGWSAVPSNRYEIRRTGEQVRIEGVGEGHGVGLCQRGAAGLAREGLSFREILAYYFPDTSLVELPAQ